VRPPCSEYVTNFCCISLSIYNIRLRLNFFPRQVQISKENLCQFCRFSACRRDLRRDADVRRALLDGRLFLPAVGGLQFCRAAAAQLPGPQERRGKVPAEPRGGGPGAEPRLPRPHHRGERTQHGDCARGRHPGAAPPEGKSATDRVGAVNMHAHTLKAVNPPRIHTRPFAKNCNSDIAYFFNPLCHHC
jgi:hypothetical protein